MVDFRRTVQIGWFEDGDGVTHPLLRELAKRESAEPQTPNSTIPNDWVDAFLRDMPNASILYRERLRKWFEACLDSGLDAGRNDVYDRDLEE